MRRAIDTFNRFPDRRDAWYHGQVRRSLGCHSPAKTMQTQETRIGVRRSLPGGNCPHGDTSDHGHQCRQRHPRPPPSTEGGTDDQAYRVHEHLPLRSVRPVRPIAAGGSRRLGATPSHHACRSDIALVQLVHPGLRRGHLAGAPQRSTFRQAGRFASHLDASASGATMVVTPVLSGYRHPWVSTRQAIHPSQVL